MLKRKTECPHCKCAHFQSQCCYRPELCLAHAPLLFSDAEPVFIQDSSPSVDRGRYVGGGSVLYVCASQGIPVPTVSWYYNGAAISSSQDVTITGSSLSISDPQIRHSGIYQCVAKNTFIGEPHEATKVWILEVRAPSKCMIY